MGEGEGRKKKLQPICTNENYSQEGVKKATKKRKVQYFILKLKYPASSQRVDRADPFLALFFLPPLPPD